MTSSPGNLSNLLLSFSGTQIEWKLLFCRNDVCASLFQNYNNATKQQQNLNTCTEKWYHADHCVLWHRYQEEKCISKWCRLIIFIHNHLGIPSSARLFHTPNASQNEP